MCGRSKRTLSFFAATFVVISVLTCGAAFGAEIGWLDKFERAADTSFFAIVTLIILATFVSEDLTCISTGLMVSQGRLSFITGFFACFLGIYIGDLLLYLGGRFIGRPLVSVRPFSWVLREKDIDRSTRWFNNRGPIVVFISRFIPGTRFPTFVAAGLLRMSFWKFSAYFFLAGLIWTPVLLTFAMVAGEAIIPYFERYEDSALWLLIGLVLVILILFKGLIPLFTYRGRRMWVGRWRRWTRWEFWPLWVFYTPVFLYILWLGFRHRCVTLFTAANPAIPHGGVIGESKVQILDLLNRSVVADYELIDENGSGEHKVEKVNQLMKNRDWSFPIVLKPDVGERGEGVQIIGSQKQLNHAVARCESPCILQEYVIGAEYGVFYYRYPDAATGNIFSITTKKMIQVRGDGTRTLEQLILDDPRAVCLANVHFEKHNADLYNVLGEGEVFQLVEIGTHCRGAVFGDGAHLITPELEAWFDEVRQSPAGAGFYFGRYDVRAPDDASLMRGEGIRVLELNGVSSESTNVYDAKFTLVEAYRVFFEQWRIAFKIGAVNASRGTRPTGLGVLFRAWLTEKKKKEQ